MNPRERRSEPEVRRWLVACDLDQTLIYSRRSFRLPAGADEPELAVAETVGDAPATFMTRRAAGLLRALAAAATVVPVTTRTQTQYARVCLGFRPRFAVTANGGHLLVDGQPDPGWEASVRARVASSSRPLADVLRAAEKIAGAWVRLTRVADELFVYLVAYERSGIPDLSGLAADLAADGWTLSVQGRKVYLVPAALTKEAAVEEAALRAGAARLAAAGDAVLDRGMLERADVAVRPSHGELHDLAWSAPHLRVTGAAGLLGGEELLDELTAATAARLS